MTVTGAGTGNGMVPDQPDHDLAAPDPASPTLSARSAVLTNRLLMRGIIAGVLAIVAGVGAWWLLGRGVRTDDFPPFLDSQTATPITRYSGPWLTAAAGAALLAALLLLAAVFDLVRWTRRRAGGALTAAALGPAAVNPAQ